MKALDLYNEVAKQFNITGKKLVHPRQQRAYADSQVQEQALIVNRLIVDAARARKSVSDAKDETVKAAYSKQLAGFEDDLRQMTRTLDFFIELSEQLAETPESDGNVERPEGF